MARYNYIRALAVLLGVLAAATLVTVLVGTEPAEAAFPGANGKIAFTSDRVTTGNPEGDYEIFAMKEDGTEIAQLTDNTGDDYAPAWSAQGNAITFTSTRDGNDEIYLMLYGGTFHGFEVRLTKNTAFDYYPTFSPDGSKIAFATDRDGDYEIYTMDISNIDGDGNAENQTNISKNSVSDEVEPAWSPLGTKIAFTSDRVTANNPEGDREIFTMNGDGSNQIQRTKNTTAIDSEPAWSSSGTKIAFSSNRVTVNNPTGDQEIFTMTAKGKKQKNRTKNAEFDRESAWSPDGRKIAFNSYQGGNAEIYTMNRDGTGQTNISNNTRFDGEPDWQPIPPP